MGKVDMPEDKNSASDRHLFTLKYNQLKSQVNFWVLVLIFALLTGGNTAKTKLKGFSTKTYGWIVVKADVKSTIKILACVFVPSTCFNAKFNKVAIASSSPRLANPRGWRESFFSSLSKLFIRGQCTWPKIIECF